MLYRLKALLGCLFMLAPVMAQAANPVDCSGLNAAIRNELRDDAGFSWKTLASAPAAPASPALRIGLWGDSLTASHDFIDAALGASGIQKSDVLPSFIQAGVGAPGVSLPLRASCASPGWETAYAYKEKPKAKEFSQGLMSMSSDQPGATLTLDFRAPAASTRLRQLTVLLHKRRPDALLVLGVSVDGGDEHLLSLTKTANDFLQITPEAPMATVKIRLVAGQLTVHGFSPVYAAAPAVTLDVMSISGALLRGWSQVDARFGAPDDYKLLLVQYGTNEGATPDFDSVQYQAYLRSNLGRLRSAYPQARCILIGPPDRGVVGPAPRAGIPNHAQVHRQIAIAQSQVGAEFGCRFWDWQAMMGGPGSAGNWAAMTPPLMQNDLTHLTAKGYAISGSRFAQAFPFNKHQ